MKIRLISHLSPSEKKKTEKFSLKNIEQICSNVFSINFVHAAQIQQFKDNILMFFKAQTQKISTG